MSNTHAEAGQAYYTTIGLEVHAELKTNSKMFCGCKNDHLEDRPNVNICPICMAHPGTLPVINKKAIEHTIKVGLALGGTIADFTEFDRKNYFYPDIPKGYQISQYKYPIVSGGELAGVTITRVHLEEDTANSKHPAGSDSTLVDYNRAGMPLMELVTEPVIHSAEQAGAFGRELHLLLRTLDVSDAQMEQGQMRVELNISVSDDPAVLGTKVEVKNIASFRSVEKAAEYEIKRMTELLESGRGSEIVQETRGWDDTTGTTISQRSKENAQDYRYFPEPDLPKLNLHELFDLEALKSSLPELAWEKRTRMQTDYGIKDESIEVFIYNTDLSDFFESVMKTLSKDRAQVAANYITSDFIGIRTANPNASLPSVEHFAELITLVSGGEITSRIAKDILLRIVEKDESPRDIATREDLLIKNDTEALEKIAQEVVTENPSVALEYQGGKETSIQFLIGQFMKKTKGSANPTLAKEILEKILKS